MYEDELITSIFNKRTKNTSKIIFKSFTFFFLTTIEQVYVRLETNL